MAKRQKKYIPLSELGELIKKYILRNFEKHRHACCIIGVDRDDDGELVMSDRLNCVLCVGLADCERSGYFDIDQIDLCQEHAAELGLTW